MKVFNSSVENRVEKAAARIETAHYYEAFSYLHKFCADCAPANFVRPHFTKFRCSTLLFDEKGKLFANNFTRQVNLARTL